MIIAKQLENFLNDLKINIGFLLNNVSDVYI